MLPARSWLSDLMLRPGQKAIPTSQQCPIQVGEHNDRVLATTLGYDAERIAALRDRGVI